MDQRHEAIERVRRFNRAYLPFMALLDQNYLGSGYSLTETRVLFEIDARGECGARDLRAALRIDKGYLSRMLRRFADEGLVERRTSQEDGRVVLVRLTQAGGALVERFAQGGRDLVGRALAGATDEQCRQLVGHMEGIERILSDIDVSRG